VQPTRKHHQLLILNLRDKALALQARRLLDNVLLSLSLALSSTASSTLSTAHPHPSSSSNTGNSNDIFETSIATGSSPSHRNHACKSSSCKQTQSLHSGCCRSCIITSEASTNYRFLLTQATCSPTTTSAMDARVCLPLSTFSSLP